MIVHSCSLSAWWSNNPEAKLMLPFVFSATMQKLACLHPKLRFIILALTVWTF